MTINSIAPQGIKADGSTPLHNELSGRRILKRGFQLQYLTEVCTERSESEDLLYS